MKAKAIGSVWGVFIVSLIYLFAWSASGYCTPASPFDDQLPPGAQGWDGYEDLGDIPGVSQLAKPGFVDLDAAIQAGADYLKGMQADITEDNAGNGFDGVDEDPDDPDDGGWDWRVTAPLFSHTTSPSSTNLYGVTALGLLCAYQQFGDATHMTALQDAADYMVAAGTGSIRSAPDLEFLMKFNDLPAVSGTAYKDAAKAKYDSRITAYGSATALAQYIRDVRGSTQGLTNGIIAWDIGAWVVVAQMLHDRYPGNGYDSDADDMAEVIYQDSFNDNPGYFDIIDDQGWDPTYANINYYWYTLGISGLIDAFAAADVHTGELPGLLSILADCRYPHHLYSFSYGANAGDEDWQSTAYSAMTLAAYDLGAYQDDIANTAGWLAITQDGSGGFVYSNGNHYPEVGGECVSAMCLGVSNVIPTLTEWGMIIMFVIMAAGIVWFVMRQRRRMATA